MDVPKFLGVVHFNLLLPRGCSDKPFLFDIGEPEYPKDLTVGGTNGQH